MEKLRERKDKKNKERRKEQESNEEVRRLPLDASVCACYSQK
jgi:hypothetical protein